MNKEKIGFFGGCFNPPSNIHINLANKLIKEQKLDKVVFVPVSDFYKKEELIEFKHRYTMLKFAIEGFDNLFVDDIENTVNLRLYAIDIFKMLEEKYSNSDLYYIMGSDNFKNMSNWKDYEELKKYNYIVLERNENDISSSNIRTMIKENRLNDNILNDKVLKYIKDNKLYLGD